MPPWRVALHSPSGSACGQVLSPTPCDQFPLDESVLFLVIKSCICYRRPMTFELLRIINYAFSMNCQWNQVSLLRGHARKYLYSIVWYIFNMMRLRSDCWSQMHVKAFPSWCSCWFTRTQVRSGSPCIQADRSYLEAPACQGRCTTRRWCFSLSSLESFALLWQIGPVRGGKNGSVIFMNSNWTKG